MSNTIFHLYLKYLTYRACLFIFKDMPRDLASNHVDTIHDTLLHVIRVCNTPSADNNEAKRNAKFSHLMNLLITELSNSNESVRSNVRGTLSLLAKLLGKTVTDLLMPVKARLLNPIFSKPLRALPFPIQIGNEIEVIQFLPICRTYRRDNVRFVVGSATLRAQ
jgi:transformation/transcription domain-associated protein